VLRQQPSNQTDIGRTASALNRDHDLMHGRDDTRILLLSPAPIGSDEPAPVNGYPKSYAPPSSALRF
jgi:hypothetical protein